jgi:superfamily II DNA or RNA helicase
MTPENRDLTLSISQNIQFSLQRLQEILGAAESAELIEIISSDLSFDNPAWLKSRKFAGKKHFFSRIPARFCFYRLRKPKTCPTIEVPIGYLEKLCRHLKDFNLQLKADNRLIQNPAKFYPGIELRPYQQKAVQSMMRKHRGYLVAPCGAGKTVMGLELIARRGLRALVIVHTNDLLKQWVQNTISFLDFRPGQICSGRHVSDSPLTIATVQTLVRHPALIAGLSGQIGTLLVDECHHIPAATFTKVVSGFRPNYLYGCSATPEREDGMSDILRLFIGPELHAVKSLELQQKEHLLRPSLEIIPTDFFYEWEDDKPEKYNEMMEKLVNDRIRNQLICRELLKHDQSLNLILSERIAHCVMLKKQLEAQNPDAQTELLTGKTHPIIREQILNKARKGEINYLFATKLADEGLDIQCLEHLWLVTPSRSVNRAQQRVGRIMRIADGKKKPVVFDFLDQRMGLLVSQFRNRFYQVYCKLLDVPAPEIISEYLSI